MGWDILWLLVILVVLVGYTVVLVDGVGDTVATGVTTALKIVQWPTRPPSFLGLTLCFGVGRVTKKHATLD